MKPYAEGMLHRAAERVPNGEIIVIVFGSPPLKFNDRFSHHESVNAVSAWTSDSGAICPMFRDARVGLYLDDVFFRDGLKKEDADGTLQFDKLSPAVTADGDPTLTKTRHDSTWLFAGASPAICRVISGLISNEDREHIKQSIIEYSKRKIEMLEK